MFFISRLNTRGLAVVCVVLIACSYFVFRQINWHTHIAQRSQCVSSIIESKSISDVLNYVSNPNTIVLFDIDNTLACPEGEVCSDQWVNFTIAQNRAAGMDEAQALAETLKIYFHAYDFIDMVPSEKNTPEILEQLKRVCIPTVAFTTRSLPIVARTIEQLALAGIQLNPPAVFDHELSFTVNEKQALFKKDIIFCNNNDKGKTLTNLFAAFNYYPETVVFVDDKISHLLAVQNECLAHNINFIGIRYGYLDDRVKNFNPKNAEKELEKLFNEHGKPSPIS